MNPWVPVIAAIGVVMIIAGYKGTQSNLLKAITGKNSGNSSSASGFGGGGFSTGGGAGGGGGGVSASAYHGTTGSQYA